MAQWIVLLPANAEFSGGTTELQTLQGQQLDGPERQLRLLPFKLPNKSHIVIPRAPYHLRARQVRRSRAGGFQRPCQRLLLGRAGIYLSQKGAEAVSVVSLNAGLAVQLSCGGFKAVRVGFHKTGSRQRLQESTAHIQASTTCA